MYSLSNRVFRSFCARSNVCWSAKTFFPGAILCGHVAGKRLVVAACALHRDTVSRRPVIAVPDGSRNQVTLQSCAVNHVEKFVCSEKSKEFDFFFQKQTESIFRTNSSRKQGCLIRSLLEPPETQKKSW